MENKNLLIGFGETLTADAVAPKGGAEKVHPYTFKQAQNRLLPQARLLSKRIRSIPLGAAPEDRAVACFTLHPAYYGKSYFPENILNRSGLRSIGSKGVRVKPERTTNKKLKGEQQTTMLYIAGSTDSYDRFASLIEAGANKTEQKEIAQFENIQFFEPIDKIKYIDTSISKHKLG